MATVIKNSGTGPRRNLTLRPDMEVKAMKHQGSGVSEKQARTSTIDVTKKDVSLHPTSRYNNVQTAEDSAQKELEDEVKAKERFKILPIKSSWIDEMSISPNTGIGEETSIGNNRLRSVVPVENNGNGEVCTSVTLLSRY